MLVVPDSIHLQHVFTSPTKRILHCRLLRVTRSDIVESVGVGGPRGVPQNEGTAGRCVVFTENGGFARGFGSLRRLQVVGMIDLVGWVDSRSVGKRLDVRDVSSCEFPSGLNNVKVDVDWGRFGVGGCWGDRFVD